LEKTPVRVLGTLQTEDRRRGDGGATWFGGTEDADLLKRYRDMGAARVVVTLPPETADKPT
jgi:hypothetical protein